MPGDNCSIVGCSVSRSKKYKGIGIYRVPTGENSFDKQWREKLINVVTKDRTIDDALRERIKNKRIFICERHYRDDQISRSETRSTPKPGEIPELNLPFKSLSSPPPTPRDSAHAISQKRQFFEDVLSDNCNEPYKFYKLLKNLKVELTIYKYCQVGKY